MITAVSPAAIPFIAAHEGTVLKAYRDSGGVWTIGIGFTMLSRTFSAYWLKTRGRALRAGDTITKAECSEQLEALLNAEYAPPVIRKFGSVANQAGIDGSTSVVYNCGPGTLKDRWAGALADRNVIEAAAFLRSTRVTAGGRCLAGLVRRRSDEARLIQIGDYGRHVTPPSVSTSSSEIRDYQDQLVALGYLKQSTGIQNAEVSRVVIKFQRDHGMIADGIVGPATRAALRRAVDAKRGVQTGASGAATGGAVGGGGEVATQQAVDWGALLTIGKWALIVGGMIFAGFMLWRYRGVIFRYRVPT